MQAIILAAGKGLRMRPLTEAVPKPLLRIGEKTILDRTLEALPEQVEEVVIVVGYLKEMIMEHVARVKPLVKVKFVEQEHLDGTASAVMACRGAVSGRFLAVNGDDLYRQADLRKLLGFDLGFLVKDISSDDSYAASSRRLGKVIFDEQGKLRGIEEGGTGNFLNIGAYALNEKFFETPLAAIGNGEFGLPQTLAGMASAGETVMVAKADFWMPIGFPEDLKAAELRLSEAP